MKSHDIRVAIYARVSSEQQAKENTIGSQLEALQERVANDGCSLEEELRFVDEGYSGASLARPALERLRDAAYAGAFDRLYVHSPDRLARKYAYQILLVEELRRCGVELVFLNRTIGDSPEEDLLLQMQGMISEYERAKILERSRRGKRHAARRGLVSVLCGAPMDTGMCRNGTPGAKPFIRSCSNTPRSCDRSLSGSAGTEYRSERCAGGWKTKRFRAARQDVVGSNDGMGNSQKPRLQRRSGLRENAHRRAPRSTSSPTQSIRVASSNVFDLRHAARGARLDSRSTVGQRGTVRGGS